MQRLDALLLRGLDRHRRNAGAAISFQYPGHVVAVGLVAAHVGAHVPRRKQAHRVALALEAARPAVRTPAGLHQHPQRRPGLQRPDERPAREALALDDPALRIGEGQLEDFFCQIDGDGTSMHGVDSSRDPVS